MDDLGINDTVFPDLTGLLDRAFEIDNDSGTLLVNMNTSYKTLLYATDMPTAKTIFNEISSDSVTMKGYIKTVSDINVEAHAMEESVRMRMNS